MKRIADAVAALMLVTSPAVALAQAAPSSAAGATAPAPLGAPPGRMVAPGGGPPGHIWGPGGWHGRGGSHGDMTARRATVLAALNPSTQRLLATIAGELATAPKPDFEQAAKRLDAALSAKESSVILAGGPAFGHGPGGPGGPPGTMNGPGAPGQPGHAIPSQSPGATGSGVRSGYVPPKPDAGRVLLFLALDVHPQHRDMGGYGRFGGGGDRGGPPPGGGPWGGDPGR